MLEEENYYLKGILSKVSGETVKGRLNNNQLLKLINENIGTGGGGSADLSKYVKKSDLDTLEITITYEDTTSETVNIALWSD